MLRILLQDLLLFQEAREAGIRQALFRSFFFVIDKIQPFCKRYRNIHIYRSLNLIHKTSKTLCITLLLMLALSGLHAASFADGTVNWLAAKGLSPRLIVLIISMLPLIELRGSIPVEIGRASCRERV